MLNHVRQLTLWDICETLECLDCWVKLVNPSTPSNSLMALHDLELLIETLKLSIHVITNALHDM